MTPFPINYAAEVRASKARHEAKIAEAKRELEEQDKRNPLNVSVRRGRKRTTATRDRTIYRAAVAGVDPRTLAERHNLLPSDVERIVQVERERMAAEDKARETADTAKRSALMAGMHDGRRARSTISRDREIARAYAAGADRYELAARYGLAITGIRTAIQRAKRAGEVVPDQRHRSRRQLIERDQALYQAWLNGASTKALAEEYGLCRKHVGDLIKREREAQGRAA